MSFDEHIWMFIFELSEGMHMRRRFKEARLQNNLPIGIVAEKLGVSQQAIRTWENERKMPSVEMLEKLADLYSVTMDYLLGRPEVIQDGRSKRVNHSLLPVLDGRPVWSVQYGWLLVNAAKGTLVSSQGADIPASDVGELYLSPLPYLQTTLPSESPLTRSELKNYGSVWVEPISSDPVLQDKLRGWYTVHALWVENSSGSRFMISRYTANWIAFGDAPLER
jgi:DNA-binding XRE family transcriptional regulator